MLITSWRYSPEARIFPQIWAGVTFFFAVIIVVQNSIFDNFGESSDLATLAQSKVSGDADTVESEKSEAEASAESEFSKAEPGEFRISQSTSQYQLPFSSQAISKRIVLIGLLVMYLLLLWLFGIFISSIVFVVCYSYTLNIRRNIAVALLLFTVGVLLSFEHWFVTPLFRPGHNMFDIEIGWLLRI